MCHNATQMEYTPRKPDRKYLNIKEASVQYEVSRAKLHRLVRSGRLSAAKDPRDERATLLSSEELEALFGFVEEEDMVTRIDETYEEARMSYRAGRLTVEARGRIDALRMRVSAGRRLPGDSTDLLREARERRSAQLDDDREDEPKRRQA